MTATPSPLLVDAVSALWRLPSGSKKLVNTSEFIRLREICVEIYLASGAKSALNFSLYKAVRAFGLPCELPHGKQHLMLSAEEAARQLDEAFRKTRTSRIHLCPLDCADELPSLTFGPATVRTFTASELEDLVNLRQLQCGHPFWTMDSKGLASFTWLVVREDVIVDATPEKRAFPFLYERFDRDIGAIEPHQRRFPASVEAALFTMLLAPWEEWVQYSNVEWRPFHIPWIYTIDSDVFSQNSLPPSSNTLSWEPFLYSDNYGEEVESERPSYIPLENTADITSWINGTTWNEVSSAWQSVIFGAPVAHFLNRAFLSKGIDEFLAHMTVIEAALGSKSDHDARNRIKLKNSNPGATYRVATRLSALLNDETCVLDFRRLFDVRSEFVHGRNMPIITSSDRILARKLARRSARELLKASVGEPTLLREAFLQRLWELGQKL